MKIALAQQNYTIGDFKSNKEKIVRCIEQAKSESADLVVFSEQAISGAPAYDLLNKVTFLELCEETLEEIARCCEGISVLVGMPAQCMNKTISVAALIEDRKIKRYVGKKTIESRDEMCHISSSKGCEYIKIRGKKIAVVVGEDIKTEQEYGEYADLIVNLAHSPYSRGVVEKRYDFYRQLAFMTGKTILYVNSVGGQTDIVYDGSSAAFNSRGEAIALLKSFEEDFQTVDVDGNETPKKIPEQNKTYNVYRAIKLGLGDFFAKSGFKTACLGLSVNNSPYIADILYSVMGVSGKNAMDAARLAGLRGAVFWCRVVLPQAVAASLAAISIRMLHNFKNTSLAMVISVPELTWASQEVESLSFAGLEVTTAATCIYLAMGGVLSLLLHWLRSSVRRRCRLEG